MKITWYITYHVTWIITCNITWFYMYVASFCTCWWYDLLQEFYIMHYMMLYMILHRITCLLHVLLHGRLHQQLHDSARFITWLFTCDFTWFYMILHDYCIGYMEFVISCKNIHVISCKIHVISCKNTCNLHVMYRKSM